MKLMQLADPHQSGSKWKEIVQVVQEEKPNVLTVAGDLFPKDNGILVQIPFIRHLKKYARKIKDVGCEMVLILGNDDNQNLVYEMKKGQEEGLWHYVADDSVTIDGYQFIGMPYVTDYPFGYKFWVRAELKDAPRVSHFQFGEPVLINSNNDFEVIPDYKEYLKSQKTIKEELDERIEKIDDFKKSIWLIHCPPSDVYLDVCSRGDKVGSRVVHDFIQETQPLLTLHGHIHENFAVTGLWNNRIGDTICIQCGQETHELHYVNIELEDGEMNMRFSLDK